MRRALASLLGVAAALLTGELVARYFLTPHADLPAGVSERFYYTEGFAYSHFGPDQRRLTGNPELGGAPNWLLIGDSYVEAFQVEDTATMGSILERLAREHGEPVNVRMYGYGGDSIGRYAGVAGELLERWHPTRVIVAINPTDFEDTEFEQGKKWRLRVAPDLSAEIVPVEQIAPGPAAPAGPVATATQDLDAFLRDSYLYKISAWRFPEIRIPAPAVGMSKPPPHAVPKDARASVAVRVLKAVYGERLVVASLSIVTPGHTSRHPDDERWLLEACASEGVPCVDLRRAFVADRDAYRRFSRGFANSFPGYGHFNEVGHRIAADEIFKVMAALEAERER